MKIALDAMGGDNAPAETVQGAVLAAREYGIEIVLVGKPDVLRAELANLIPPVSASPSSLRPRSSQWTSIPHQQPGGGSATPHSPSLSRCWLMAKWTP